MAILVIEDEVEVARHLCNGLRESGYTVLWAANGTDGLHMAMAEKWDLLVIDRMLPNDVDGLSIVQKLRSKDQTVPVLILSALATLDERVRGLRGGGDDYLTKPFAFAELLARVEVLLRRNRDNAETVELGIADLKLDLRMRRVERAGQQIALQPREFRLLEFLIRHQGQVVTRTMLLESVWGYHFDPQTSVIDVQISRLRNKIDRDFSPPLLHTVRGVGYRIGVDG